MKWKSTNLSGLMPPKLKYPTTFLDLSNHLQIDVHHLFSGHQQRQRVRKWWNGTLWAYFIFMRWNYIYTSSIILLRWLFCILKKFATIQKYPGFYLMIKYVVTPCITWKTPICSNAKLLNSCQNANNHDVYYHMWMVSHLY